MNKAIMRMEKHKNFQTIKAASNHHYRKNLTLNANPKIKNKRLIGSENIDQDVEKIINEKCIKLRKNGIKALEFVCTASPDFFELSDDADIQKFSDKALAWAQNEFGKENVVNAVLHLDETTPHLHLTVVPVDSTEKKKGAKVRLNADKWIGGKEKLSKLQDSFFESVKCFGLERGIKGSKAKHTKVKQYYNILESQTLPKVQLPVIKSDNTKWFGKGKELENRINKYNKKVSQNLKPVLRDVIRTAKVTTLANKKKKELEITAISLSRENEKLSEENKMLKNNLQKQKRMSKEYLDKLRDLDLEHVAEKLGLEKNRYNLYISDNDNTIKIENNKFYDHYFKVGGYGSIDLVKYINDCSFNEAIEFLCQNFNKENVVGAVNTNTRAEEKVNDINAKKKTFKLPKRYDDCWSEAKKYLVEDRMIDESIVDMKYKEGKIYATKKNGYINVVYVNNQENMAEIEGIDRNKKFKGVVAASNLEAGGFRIHTENPGSKLVIVESAVDAMSYYELHRNDENFVVMSMAGARVKDADVLYKAYENNFYVYCGYDNDSAGLKAGDDLKNILQMYREKPANEDWNEDLKKNKMALKNINIQTLFNTFGFGNLTVIDPNYDPWSSKKDVDKPG